MHARSFLNGAAFFAAMFVVPAMAAESYMQIPEINGNAGDSQHAGWITLTGVGWSAPPSSLVRRPSAAPPIHTISLSRRTDKLSAALMNASTRGRHFPLVIIDNYEDNGSARRIRLDDVVIGSYAMSGGNDNFTLQFSNASTTALPGLITTVRPVQHY